MLVRLFSKAVINPSIALSLLLFSFSSVKAQGGGAKMVDAEKSNTSDRIIAKELNIGDQVPDLEFSDLINYKTSSARLSDFKGKVVILDFWATWCAPCVAEMPRLDSMRASFGDKLVIIPISSEDRETVAAFIKKRKDLKLSFYVDKAPAFLRTLFPFKVLPHTIIIDGEGKVAAITRADNVKKENINDLLNGRSLSLYRKKDLMNLDKLKPLFINGNGVMENKILLHSLLSPYLEGTSSSYNTYHVEEDIFLGFNVINIAITQLYMKAFAYPHIYTNRLLLEGISDSSRYPIRPKDYKKGIEWKREFLYCYDIVSPYRKMADHERIMQDDLNRAFFKMYGLKVQVQKRLVKCYVVKKLDNFSTIKEVLDYKTLQDSLPDIEYRNIKIAELEGYLIEYLNWKPIVDETGVGTKEIRFRKDKKYTSNISALKNELHRHGLEIVESEREVDMLVFKEQSTTTNRTLTSD